MKPELKADVNLASTRGQAVQGHTPGIEALETMFLRTLHLTDSQRDVLMGMFEQRHERIKQLVNELNVAEETE